MSSRRDPTDLVRLRPLMELGSGSADLLVAVIDGSVAMDHKDLSETAFRQIGGNGTDSGLECQGRSCKHGTFVAGMLAARRGSVAPGICPGCTFLIRPIFGERFPSVTPDHLAQAIADCLRAGARVVNISAAIMRPAFKSDQVLEEALNWAARRGVLVVSAAGNQGLVASTAITRHPWVIPVAACDLQGRPMDVTNLGRSIALHGLRAPGEGINSLDSNGEQAISDGTSAATPFVTGAIALLWSLFPRATAAQIRLSITRTGADRRNSVAPPLLDAWAAYQSLAGSPL